MASEEELQAPNSGKKGLLKTFEKTPMRGLKKLTEIAEHGGQAIQTSRQALANTAREMQHKWGEDCQAILDCNPVVQSALQQSELLVANKDLLSTAFNLPWTTMLLWTASAGSAVVFQRPVAGILGDAFHYGPGHATSLDSVNRFMDSVSGSGHRLKFGHSLEYLPQIVERFGVEGVPAFCCHLLQDFTTVDGIPIVPNAWSVKQHLAMAGIAPKTATALVSLSASQVLATLAVAVAVRKICLAVSHERERRDLLRRAKEALEHGDEEAATESYKQAYAIENNPAVLMALGQAYLRRRGTRPAAHRAFKDAMKDLAADCERVVPYEGAKISLRGLAGFQALATADVLNERFQQEWQEQVEGIVNATVNSFRASAERQENTKRLVSRTLFSAAINRVLAAKAACQHPFLKDRQQIVSDNLKAALGSLTQIRERNSKQFSGPIHSLREVWARTLLPQDEAEEMLRVY